MKTNRASKLMIGAFFAVATAFGAQTITPSMLGCEDAKAIVGKGGKLELGKWYTDWATVKKYSEDNNVPVLFLWSNHGCIHCYWTDLTMMQDSFKAWAATHDAGKVIYCFMAGGEKGYPDDKGSAAYNWMWKQPSSLDAFPFVTLYWPGHGKNGIVLHKTGDQFNSNSSGKKPDNFWSEKSLPERVENVIYWMETTFAGWHPEPEVTYDGGHFTQTNYPFASLQAEKSTGSVAVEIVRDSLRAASQKMKIYVDGSNASAQTETISWDADQKAQTYVIASFGTKWFAKGKDVVLQLFDDEDKVMSEVRVACVEAENSASNPKWIGESFGFGEWTMDLDAAKKLAKKTAGKAYVLASVQGSQWCPDCGNVERNFLGANGGKDFIDWAKQHNVALVAVDIPNFKQADPDGATSPCLLKRDPHTGAPDGTPAQRSGLGYLTRKEISDADALEVLERNRMLASANTSEGGFHRPEDANSHRTGVPIFVMMDKDGVVRARLTYMASKSPADSSGFANILKRFDEMLWIADNNKTEIENNYASAAGSVSFAANGGSETATISHTDLVDTFHLDGVGGNARQLVRVSGSSDAKVVVSLLKLEGGKEVVLAKSAAAKLSDGVELEYVFTEAADCYAKVEADSITSPEYALENPAANNFQEYVITGTVLLEPQEDRATAKPAAGSDKVTMRVVEGTVYRISGMASCPALEPLPDAEGYYAATAGGDFEVTLTKVDGEISYQIWNSGDIGFEPVELTVEKSVCDETGTPLEITVARIGGKSGAVEAHVSIDWEQTTAHPAHVWLTNAVDLAWADGDTAAKTVQLYLDDDPEWQDVISDVVLTVEVVGSEAGDVGVAAGRGQFVLTVIDNGTEPGEAYFTTTEPVAVDGAVHVRASEGARIGIVRTGGDMLVSGILKSTVSGTVFLTEDPRDIEDLGGGKARFWWSASESDERGGEKFVTAKVPAGKDATVTFTPEGELGDGGVKSAVTIVSVADDAPGFVSVTNSFSLTRYVDFAANVGTTGHQEGATISFKVISGKLPSGLKISVADAGALSLAGVPTAKAGDYEAVCQAIEKRGSKKVDGLLCSLSFNLVDVTAKGPGGAEPLNPALAKSRTFKDIPVYDAGSRRLSGTLQVTVPTKGSVSAKYTGLAGKYSFSAKNWSSAQPNGSLLATLVCKADKSLEAELQANPDGSVGLVFTGGALDGSEVWTDGKSWSKDNTAADWVGNYTVALAGKKVVESAEGVAPRGYGYLTLTMKASDAKKGTVKVAGQLADGTKVSGSYVLRTGLDEKLNAANDDRSTAYLPIFKSSSKDVYSALVGIAAKAFGDEDNFRCVHTPEWCDGYWRHEEKSFDFEQTFAAYGSWYDLSKVDLGGCCAKYYQTTHLLLYLDGLDVAGVHVHENDVLVDDADKSVLKLSLNRSTGVVTGTYTGDAAGKLTYAGVIVNGWGEGCGCEAVPDGTVFLPFMCGSGWQKVGKTTYGREVLIDKKPEQ